MSSCDGYFVVIVILEEYKHMVTNSERIKVMSTWDVSMVTIVKQHSSSQVYLKNKFLVVDFFG